jgi:hypothetical protein
MNVKAALDGVGEKGARYVHVVLAASSLLMLRDTDVIESDRAPSCKRFVISDR